MDACIVAHGVLGCGGKDHVHGHVVRGPVPAGTYVSTAVGAVSFDAAFTLFEPAAPVARTYSECAREHGIDADPAAVGARFADAFAQAPPLAFGALDCAELDRAERAWWRDVVARSLGPAARGSPGFEACNAALYAHYARAQAWRVYSDAEPALAALAARGLPLVVLSNFDSRLPPLLDALALRGYFRAVIYSSHLLAPKPDPSAFRAAAEAAGVPVERLVHVGDSAEADVAGAEHAGAASYRIARAGAPGPHLRSLRELCEQLGT